MFILAIIAGLVAWYYGMAWWVALLIVIGGMYALVALEIIVKNLWDIITKLLEK